MWQDKWEQRVHCERLGEAAETTHFSPETGSLPGADLWRSSGQGSVARLAGLTVQRVPGLGQDQNHNRSQSSWLPSIWARFPCLRLLQVSTLWTPALPPSMETQPTPQSGTESGSGSGLPSVPQTHSCPRTKAPDHCGSLESSLCERASHSVFFKCFLSTFTFLQISLSFCEMAKCILMFLYPTRLCLSFW